MAPELLVLVGLLKKVYMQALSTTNSTKEWLSSVAAVTGVERRDRKHRSRLRWATVLIGMIAFKSFVLSVASSFPGPQAAAYTACQSLRRERDRASI